METKIVTQVRMQDLFLLSLLTRGLTDRKSTKRHSQKCVDKRICETRQIKIWTDSRVSKKKTYNAATHDELCAPLLSYYIG